MKTARAKFGIPKTALGLTARIYTSSLGPLLSLLLTLPALGAQAAVVFTSLYAFTGTNDGGVPNGLVQGNDGSFYGTTYSGGTNNAGTVFKIRTNGALTSLYSFTGGNDGMHPQGALVQASDGNLYGTTYGWPTGAGTVFKISTSGALVTLYSFGSVLGNNGYRLDGAHPRAALVQGSDSYFYGTTKAGGTDEYGTVFKISTTGALKTLHSFSFPPDGEGPESPLVQGSDGYFYGTTDGRPYNTVFKISTDGAFTNLLMSGAGSFRGLAQGGDGNLYGTIGANRWLDGSWSYGSVFKISTTGAFSCLRSFNGGNDGADPEGGLVQGSDGSFYGTTECNSFTNPCMDCSERVGAGTVFKISSNGTLTTLYTFGSITNASGVALDGAYPCAALVQGSDGSFYGTTSGGGTTNYNEYSGTYGLGTVFRLTIVPDPQLTLIPSGSYVILTWPTDSNGFSYAGYTLQSTTNLLPSAVWTTTSPGPVVIGGQNAVINTISGRQQFYRLNQQSP